MIIDAENMIIGRLATFAAKNALLGQDINIVNCEKAVITGNKDEILTKYKLRRNRGTHAKGPFYHRTPEKFVKRIVRGMIPYKKERGEKAFKRVMCYRGVPEDFAGQEMVKVEGADIKKVPNLKYMTVTAVCKFMGGKI